VRHENRRRRQSVNYLGVRRLGFRPQNALAFPESAMMKGGEAMQNVLDIAIKVVTLLLALADLSKRIARYKKD
jgi:hypothetical protein